MRQEAWYSYEKTLVMEKELENGVKEVKESLENLRDFLNIKDADDEGGSQEEGKSFNLDLEKQIQNILLEQQIVDILIQTFELINVMIYTDNIVLQNDSVDQ